MAPVRLCIVGCGVIVDSHLLAIAAASPAEFVVTALVDPDVAAREKIAARVAAELGTEAPAQFASLTEALEADPDAAMFEAVDLLVPSIGTLHEDISIEAMRAGRHVLLEKPVAVSMDSAARILAAGQELMAAKVFMVAENSQYISEIVAAQKLIRDGAIGCGALALLLRVLALCCPAPPCRFACWPWAPDCQRHAVSLRSEVLTARAKYWESCSYVINPQWASSYEPGTFYCTADEGFTFDGGLHWIRPLRM